MDQVHISSPESTTCVPSPIIHPPPTSKSNEIPKRNPHQPPIPYPLSFAEALAQMPKYAKMLKDLLSNKEKLLELANTPLNENCSTLANRSVAYPAGIAEDVFVQVGRPFLRTARALVDVYEEELTLELISLTRHARIIFTKCNVQKSINPLSGSPTHSSDPVVASLSPSLTPFGDNDFLLEEIDALFALDDSIPPEIDDGIFDLEGDVLLLEKLLNNDSTKDLPPKELKNDETKTSKYSIEEPPDLELKDLPPLLGIKDYALWDVIENGNSFKPAAQTTTNADGSSTTLIPGPVTADEKTQKKNDVKARSMLLMALPNEHLLTFNQYKDAKTLFAAIQTSFGESLNSIFKNALEDCKPSEWNTPFVVWRNKPDLDTMSFDDLYNNFKIVEQEVKGTASSSSSSQNLAFMSSTSSTNEVRNAYGVSTANTQASTASTQKISRKITINRSDTAGYDKSKAECFNCHKLGHFARECRGPRNQNNRSRNQDNSRRTINVEEISSKAMLAIDGAGFDWSFMADASDMALMAFSDSEVHNDKTCLKTCLKSFETLKTQLDDLRIEFNKSEFNLATYKIGLTFVEEQLVFYKKNDVLFCEQLAIIKRDISYKDSEIIVLKSELEKLNQDKESNQLKIENFDNASKRLFSPPTIDLSNSGLEEFQQPEFEGYGPKISKSVNEDISNEVMKSLDAPLVEELVSNVKLEKKTVFPTVAKINFVKPQQQEKPVRKPVKYAEMYKSQTPKGNQRN
ncbi:ribonuclease H-like domain-containing protein [Tanacetum coccineum]